MSERVLEIRVPERLLQYGYDQKEVQRHITEWLVLSLFVEGRISSGKAAQLLNISRVEFLALLHKRGIAFIDYDPEELAEEFNAVKRLQVDHEK